MGEDDTEKLKAEKELNAYCDETIRAWAIFETTLFFYFQILSGIGDQFRARVIWSCLPNIQAKRKVLTRLAEHFISDPGSLKKFRTFMKRKSKTKRNLIAHCACGIMEDGKVNFTILDQKSEEYEFEFVELATREVSNIKNWASDIKTLMSDMMNSLPEISASLHKSPKTQRVKLPGKARS